MTSHNRLDGLGSFICVVEGNGANVVVKNVGFDDTVEKSATDKSKFTIDGCGGSTNVVPALAGIVGKSWIGVLKECDGDEPVVDPEIWDKVPDGHVVETVGLGEYGESGDGDGDTKITQQNQFGILGFVKRTFWVEVTDGPEAVDFAFSATFRLTLMVVVSGDVHEQVQRPAGELLSNRVNKCCNWSFLCELVELVNEFSDASSIVLTSLWNEDHVALHVTSCLVVLAVGDLP